MNIPDGIWTTMITPFDKRCRIDFDSIHPLINWYERQGVDGIFSVCQSSEMHSLSLSEKKRLATECVAAAADRIPVIASGITAVSRKEMLEEIEAVAESGVAAVVLLTNSFAGETECDSVWKSNIELLLKELPDELMLGLYECPRPYKRIIAPGLLQWICSLGRFYFLKDTSCNASLVKSKLAMLKSSNFKLFNANSATLLDTLAEGAAGYCGVMANFHPELYALLYKEWKKEPKKALVLQWFLSLASVIEKGNYPLNAKYALRLLGLPVNPICKTEKEKLSVSEQREVEQLIYLSRIFPELLNHRDLCNFVKTISAAHQKNN